MADMQKLAEVLRSEGFTVSCYETADEASAALCQQIRGKTVGMGGSKTLEALGLYEKLGEHNQVFWHWKQPVAEARANSAAAQVYLTSANGVAETGEIINIDGDGNRLAATVFGKEKVYFLIGVNKIAPNFHAALDRARNVAAPLNARRLNKKTPCAQGSELRCYDCSSPDRICKGMTVLYRPMGGVGETEVVLINEELGY